MKSGTKRSSQNSVKRLNALVEAGQLLVSGAFGQEDNPELVAAKGEVWGETWYKSHVELPLVTNFKVFNGK